MTLIYPYLNYTFSGGASQNIESHAIVHYFDCAGGNIRATLPSFFDPIPVQDGSIFIIKCQNSATANNLTVIAGPGDSIENLPTGSNFNTRDIRMFQATDALDGTIKWNILTAGSG